MGCPSDVVLGDFLVFSYCTYHPTTGVLTNADTNPSYRVYTDANPTPVATGTMAALDSGNTTGFYTGLLACTSGSGGFIEGPTYTIYVEAAVAANKIGTSFAFKTKTKTGYATTQADQQASADEFLNRNLAGGGSGGPRIVRDAFRLLRNFRRIVSGILTVYQEDDNSPAWTATVTTASGNPTNSIDPT